MFLKRDAKWKTARCSVCEAWIAIPDHRALSKAEREEMAHQARVSKTLQEDPRYAHQAQAERMCPFCAYLHGVKGGQLFPDLRDSEKVFTDAFVAGLTE